MGASVSYKLKNSLQGALAGGGDPATSPLYVFGPFLSLIVGAGVAEVTFGASIWMAVFTVIAVSAMYRYVMIWITDGSGGSGLSEEEFGGWAVKVNASITVIEYTLTFLVSIAALVTFVADRAPALSTTYGLFDLRTLLAVGLSILVMFAVNRGPKISAIFFGPATALILIFLWVMIFAEVFQHGLILPNFDLNAFNSEHLHFTLGGFARILALMTGIEIFANLVASYEGNASQRSKKAFGSLLIVMGTTVVTMLIVGPAIFRLADPSVVEKSVFTQTMDALLPAWLSYSGTFIGIIVLLSAAAASMQGMQNLALGLRARHYFPASWGKRNKYDVPSVPALIQTLIVVIAFLVLGTHEETYLSLYAAGVFILLSMTAWSASKRFLNFFRTSSQFKNILGLFISVFSALCASFATFIIFEERFTDGAWSYFVMIPLLYVGFDFFRKRLGPPPGALSHRISAVINSAPINLGKSVNETVFKVRKILVPLDGKAFSEFAFHQAVRIATKVAAEIKIIFINESLSEQEDLSTYLTNLSESFASENIQINNKIYSGEVASEIVKISNEYDFDLICMSSAKMDRASKIIHLPVSFQVIHATTPPVLFLRPSDSWKSRASKFKKILVPLDGSDISEQVLPYATSWAKLYGAEVTLLHTPEEQGDEALAEKMKLYLDKLVETYFTQQGVNAKGLVEGSGPARTILHHLENNGFDLIVMASHGRGGLDRQKNVPLGSVTESVLAKSDVPVLFISAVRL